jgi:hypothetical protein
MALVGAAVFIDMLQGQEGLQPLSHLQGWQQKGSGVRPPWRSRCHAGSKPYQLAPAAMAALVGPLVILYLREGWRYL